MIKSCYVHIPFCKKICSYCDFCKNYYNEKTASNYLDALSREIKKNYKNDLLNTLYIGGGTPSSLSFENLKKLFKILKIFRLNKDYEFTFEVNYEDITEDLLLFLKENKVNRLSIGIQTFNKKYKNILNRSINNKDMINSIKLAKKHFDNVNVDLMYALTGESIEDLKKDLNKIIKLQVNHVSTYALIIEEHTNLSIKKVKEVSDDVQNNMYYTIKKKLEKKGYNQYELSNYSKKGYESRHNITYWKNNWYYGFGAGASGFISNKRYDNTKSVNNYIKGKTVSYEELLDKLKLMKDEVMLNLRLTSGINKAEFYNKYKVKLEDAFLYKPLVAKGFLCENDENLYIPNDKLFVSNMIIIDMLDTYKLE